MIGSVLGNYVVRAVVGRGGMGEVYRAEHPLGMAAAVKFLNPELSADPQAVERFFNEARAASTINHPGIVKVFDSGFVGKRAYLLMEFLDGESLRARLTRSRSLVADLRLLRSIVDQIAGALHAAHVQDIVHRDLKPDNVFLLPSPDRQLPIVKVLDFGIAKLGAGKPSFHTTTGALMGTPVYMSPEQCRGAGKVDHRSDLYSLGCILFELLTGAPPFAFEGPGEVIAAHIHDPPPNPAVREPAVPPDLEALTLALLAKDPDARPQSMAQVQQMIRQGPGSSSLELPATAGFEPGAAPVSPIVGVTTLSSVPSEITARPRRRRLWRVAVGGAVVVGMGVAALLLRPTTRPTAAPVAAPAPTVTSVTIEAPAGPPASTLPTSAAPVPAASAGGSRGPRVRREATRVRQVRKKRERDFHGFPDI